MGSGCSGDGHIFDLSLGEEHAWWALNLFSSTSGRGPDLLLRIWSPEARDFSVIVRSLCWASRRPTQVGIRCAAPRPGRNQDQHAEYQGADGAWAGCMTMGPFPRALPSSVKAMLEARGRRLTGPIRLSRECRRTRRSAGPTTRLRRAVCHIFKRRLQPR